MIGPTLWKTRGRVARGAWLPVPAAALMVCPLAVISLVAVRGQTTVEAHARHDAATIQQDSASPLATPRLVTQARPAMGTTFTVRLFVTDETRADELVEAVFEEIERIEEALSHYRSTSEISRINRAAPSGIVTDPETFALLARAQEISRQSDGAFDITVGPLMQAWGFFRGRGHYPSASELADARARTGWRHVTLDAAQRTIRTDRAGISLDLGGMGKGYALDRAAALLRAAGVTRALLDAGSSSFYAIGAPPGTDGWLIRVPDGEQPTRTIAQVRLRDSSLSTSGTQQQFFTLNARRYSHIVNPATGHPVEGMSQVTVLAPSATDSDALTKVAFVMGPERAPEVLAQTTGTAALFVRDTSGDRIETWRWPTIAQPPNDPRSLTGKNKRPNGPRPNAPPASRAQARIVSGHAAAPARERTSSLSLIPLSLTPLRDQQTVRQTHVPIPPAVTASEACKRVRHRNGSGDQ